MCKHATAVGAWYFYKERILRRPGSGQSWWLPDRRVKSKCSGWLIFNRIFLSCSFRFQYKRQIGYGQEQLENITIVLMMISERQIVMRLGILLMMLRILIMHSHKCLKRHRWIFRFVFLVMLDERRKLCQLKGFHGRHHCFCKKHQRKNNGKKRLHYPNITDDLFRSTMDGLMDAFVRWKIFQEMLINDERLYWKRRVSRIKIQHPITNTNHPNAFRSLRDLILRDS